MIYHGQYIDTDGRELKTCHMLREIMACIVLNFLKSRHLDLILPSPVN
jgi:hypothetical protein